jgi:hypothetical protein
MDKTLEDQLLSDHTAYFLRGKEVEKQIRETKPYRRPNKDYFKSYFIFNLRKEESLKVVKDTIGQFRYFTNQILTKRHSSNVLDYKLSLSPITLKDMKVNKTHLGKYLECKTVADSFYMFGLFLLVTDSDNQCEELSIYNYYATTGFRNVDPCNLFPFGTHFIIKEPLLKLKAAAIGEYEIRVDSPSDIVILHGSSVNCYDNVSTEILTRIS